MTIPPRYGITFPFDGIPLLEQRELVRELVDLGYTDLWSAESGGYDAFIPLAVAAQWAPELRFGTAIVPAYTRGAHTLASTVASMCQAAPGRFALGLGTSSNVIVERWNGMTFDKPYQRVRDTIRFLRAALTGEKVTEEYETFKVKGFKLGRPLPPDIPAPKLRPARPSTTTDGASSSTPSPGSQYSLIHDSGTLIRTAPVRERRSRRTCAGRERRA